MRGWLIALIVVIILVVIGLILYLLLREPEPTTTTTTPTTQETVPTTTTTDYPTLSEIAGTWTFSVDLGKETGGGPDRAACVAQARSFFGGDVGQYLAAIDPVSGSSTQFEVGPFKDACDGSQSGTGTYDSTNGTFQAELSSDCQSQTISGRVSTDGRTISGTYEGVAPAGASKATASCYWSGSFSGTIQ